MFPLRDSAPRDKFPFINYILIIANVYIFFLQLASPNFERFVYQFGFIPAEFNLFDLESYKYIFTSIFLHGGFLHVLSNMWFLHIFGDNLEDRLGHFKYLAFYFLGGLIASLAQYVVSPESTIPMIGASGAVSAIAGAYFVFFKGHTIDALVTYFLFWDVIELPATFFLGYWFVIQVFSGVGSLASVAHGGVAWFAHIGGFIFGYFVARSMRQRPEMI